VSAGDSGTLGVMSALERDVAPVVAAPPVVLPRGREVDLGARGVTFIREIDGPPDAPTVFLLHGWLATADLNWFGCYELLGRHFRVIAIDHRGHGRGIRTRDRFRLADCADDVAAVCSALALPPVIPVGYSMGGPVAQLVWHRHPELVAGLVLCATARDFAGKPGERAAFAMLGGATAVARAMPERMRLAVRERVTGNRFDGDTPGGLWARSEFDRSDGRLLLEAGHSLGRFSSRNWIGGVGVPTAVVLTELDGLVPPHRQRKLADAIPGARIFPIAGDHVVCSMQTELFAPVLLRACQDVAARATVTWV
jgi:pimeloyl-ACP methyl ester carboxylesterase